MINMDKKTEGKTGPKKEPMTLSSLRDSLNNIGKKTIKDSSGALVPDNSRDDYVPGYPEVNLLPQKVKEGYAAQDLLKKFVVGGIATAGVFAILFGVSLVSENIYKEKIEKINTTTAQSQAEITGLDAYSRYRTAVDGKRAEISGVMKGQVDVGLINNNFKKAAEQAGYEISSVSLSVSGGDAAVSGSCVNPDPFSPATGIGCLTFSLKDTKGSGSMSKLYSIADNPNSTGFSNIYVPSALNSEEGSSIDGSVSVTEKFYLTKYDNLQEPLDSALQGGKAAEQPTGTEAEAGK